jgi:hypothetical protein
MSGWHSIVAVSERARAKLVEFAAAGIIPTRARMCLEDRYSDETKAAISAAQLDWYRAQGGGFEGPTTEELAAFIAAAPTVRVATENHPIDPKTWELMARDDSIWSDGAWAQNGGKFGTYFVGIEFSFGDLDALAEHWLPNSAGRNGAPSAPARRNLAPSTWHRWAEQYRKEHAPLPDVDRVILPAARAAFPDHHVTQQRVRDTFGGGKKGPRKWPEREA